MSCDMIIEKAVSHVSKDNVEGIKKSPYSKPVLQVFGSIKKLTQQGNGSGGDGGVTAGMVMLMV